MGAPLCPGLHGKDRERFFARGSVAERRESVTTFSQTWAVSHLSSANKPCWLIVNALPPFTTLPLSLSIYISICKSVNLSIYPIPSHPIRSYPIPSHPINLSWESPQNRHPISIEEVKSRGASHILPAHP